MEALLLHLVCHLALFQVVSASGSGTESDDGAGEEDGHQYGVHPSWAHVPYWGNIQPGSVHDMRRQVDEEGRNIEDGGMNINRLKQAIKDIEKELGISSGGSSSKALKGLKKSASRLFRGKGKAPVEDDTNPEQRKLQFELKELKAMLKETAKEHKKNNRELNDLEARVYDHNYDRDQSDYDSDQSEGGTSDSG